MSKTLRLKRPGSAMVLSLLLVVILLIMGGGLLGLGFQSRVSAVQTTSEIAARCAADAGLTKALFEMNEKLKVQPWDGDSLPLAENESLPNCDAVFGFTVEQDDNGNYVVESVGEFGWAQRKIRGILPLQGPSEYAIFAEDSISLASGTVVDWCNYSEDERKLQVGTNSIISDSIDLKNGVTINGDVVVGVGGEPDAVINDHGATITGEIYAVAENHELEPVTVPEWLELLPSGGTIKNNTTITSSGKYSEIDLENSKIITIDGAVTLYVTGDVTLGNSAQIQVVDDNTNPDAHLILYLGGDFEGKNGSDINNLSNNAKKFKLYGLDTCHNIDIKNSGVFYGVICTPNADVVIHNYTDVYGAIISNNFEQKNYSTFTNDS